MENIKDGTLDFSKMERAMSNTMDVQEMRDHLVDAMSLCALSATETEPETISSTIVALSILYDTLGCVAGLNNIEE